MSRGSVSHSVAVPRSAPAFRGGVSGRAVVRGGVLPGGGYYYRPNYYGSYYRPFYSFVPRFSLGLGLWVGNPFSWSAYYGYGYPYYGAYYPPYYYGAYSSPYPYYPPYSYDDPPRSSAPAYPPPSNYGDNSGTYPQPPNGYTYQQQPNGTFQQQPNGAYQQQPNGSIGVPQGGQPGDQQASGGMTFEITPSDASVFIDGTYMGTGHDFGPTLQPLGLSVGRHHIEIRAEGYKTMSFDADVTAGQVTPYRATLQRR